MAVKIITDSMSDISPDVAEVYGIEVIPINISFGGAYFPVSEVPLMKTIEWIEENKKHPEFKGVGSETYARVFKEYIAKSIDVLCITGGSSIISSYDCASFAAAGLQSDHIHVIDTHQLCASVGFMAIRAAAMANAGMSANAIEINFERNIKKCKQFGIADKVDFLQYAGICPKIVSIGSGLLNAKFEFEVQPDMSFNVQILGSSMKKAVPSYCSKVFKNIDNIESDRIFMMHTLSDEDYFTEVYRCVEELDYFEDIVVCEAGHFTSSLVGRNGISVAYQMK